MNDQNNNNKIYNPDELIADIYEVVYEKQNYEPDLIDLKNTDLNRFKMSDYDLDIIFNKIVYSGNYPTGIIENGENIDEIHFKRSGETYTSTIRIVPYLNINSINDKSDPINVNQIMKTILSELVVTDKTTNILLPIINVDVTGSDLFTRDIVSEYIDKNKFYSIEITEKYYKLTDLDNFFKNYPIEPKVLKSIIYQAIDVLYQIGSAYPMFRYNQLIPDKINCYLKKTGDIIVPELKLSYFYLSNIKNLIENDYLSTLNIPFIDSQYSDLYQLLNYMWNNVWVDIQKYPEIIKIFDIILPEKIRSKESYLTQEIWNKLSDDEKFNLTPRNIKNSGLFTSKDSLLNTTFISQNNDELSGGQETDNDLTFQESEIYFTNPISQNDDIDILDEEYNDDLYTLGSLTNSNELRTITNQSNSNNRNESRNKRQNNLNKKYYHNHIDNMRGKRSNNRYDDDSDKLNSTNQEYTEDKTFTNSSKLISVSDVDSDIKKSNRNNYTRQSRISDTSNNNGNNRKNKAYRGKRQIKNQHASGIISDKNLENLGLVNNMANTNASNISSATQNGQMFDGQMFDGQGTRINSIGSLLGVNPNEILKPNNTNYSQIVQQLSRQLQNDPSQQQQFTPYGNQMLMSNFTPNNSSQVQMPMQSQMLQNQMLQNQMLQNPMAQNPMAQNIYSQGMGQTTGILPGQQENDLLARYLSAANQVPGQSMSNLDPNLLSTLMQQTPQTSYMAQTGGANSNKNFFFR
ncbi:hypothetical protein QJ854_gp450 [Moumouvirus goulette]|uniref:Uncharacterized protein n=1 Tax=Moumouvirus goulette TaxID=1247379 RepID=M1PX49_9VIRU|nr:hypothetical protein QJ854_gp450 [Moumouvirus goulette]AGF85332.1 hypothetical protein glt_00523 [Moumouvirus goulette]